MLLQCIVAIIFSVSSLPHRCVPGPIIRLCDPDILDGRVGSDAMDNLTIVRHDIRHIRLVYGPREEQLVIMTV